MAIRGCTERRASEWAAISLVDHGEDPLLGGLRLERSEELSTEFEPDFRLVGFLNDDSNPVGSVHLGVVFMVEADGHSVGVCEAGEAHLAASRPQTQAPAAWERLEQ